MKFALLAAASLAFVVAGPSAPAAPPVTRPAAAAAAAAAAEPRQYLAKCTIERPAGVAVSPAEARPYLLVAEGQPATISFGADVPAGRDDADDAANVGLSVRLRVSRSADGALRAAVRLADGRLTDKDPAAAVVTEVSASTVRPVKTDEPFALALPDGTKLTMRLVEVAPAK